MKAARKWAAVETGHRGRGAGFSAAPHPGSRGFERVSGGSRRGPKTSRLPTRPRRASYVPRSANSCSSWTPEKNWPPHPWNPGPPS